MTCKCADDVDTKLAGRNTRLTRAMVFDPTRQHLPNLLLQTEQIETGRGKPKAVGMFLSYCPFCGERYLPLPADEVLEPSHGQ